MRMRAAVASPLREREVLLPLHVVNALGGEPLDRLGEPAGVVGHVAPPGDLGLGQAAGVDDRLFPLDLLPLEAPGAAVGVEALAVLPRRGEQAAGHLGADVGVAEL